MKKKAAKIFTAFIMTAIIAQGTVMVAGAAETDSTPDSVICQQRNTSGDRGGACGGRRGRQPADRF